MLDTVDLPIWLSGIKKALATGLSTPIWWRTCVRSGRVAGSISQRISKGLSTNKWYFRSCAGCPTSPGWPTGPNRPRDDDTDYRSCKAGSLVHALLLGPVRAPVNAPEITRLQVVRFTSLHCLADHRACQNRGSAAKCLCIVNGADTCPMTPRPRCRARKFATRPTSILGISLVTAISAAALVSPRHAAAGQVSDFKAQAAQIAKDLILEQLQIGTYDQQYDVDTAKVQQEQAQIQSTEAAIIGDASRVGRDRQRLQSEAIFAYMHLDTQASGVGALFSDQKQVPTRTEYEVVASGDIALAIDALRSDEKQLRAAKGTLEQQQARDQATTRQEAVLQSAAHQTQAELQSKQSEVQGQLAVAVAQQQAAQSAAAAAAVQMAQAAAAAAATTTTLPPQRHSTSASSTSTSVPSASTTDPSLPPFLKCVLQAESGGDYSAVSPDGMYMGGFQFSQATWNEAAQLAGMPQLVNVPPNLASPAEQDDLAIALYQADGQQPWNDSCRNS
jgi:Transglycosylase-like domain